MASAISATSSSALPGYDEYAQTYQSTTGWSSPSSILTKLFSGDPIAILIAAVVAFSFPILLHLYFFHSNPGKSKSRSSEPVFLLLGPANAGKTALVAQVLQRNSVSSDDERPEGSVQNGVKTHYTQHSYPADLRLPLGTPLGSNKYRSENDPEVLRANKLSAPYRLIDTPGHGKLRAEHALSHLNAKQQPTGVLFMLDSTTLDPPDSASAQDTIGYLYDVLLQCQTLRRTISKRDANDFPVLIAANKQDLFTALPEKAVKKVLEQELDRIKTSRRKGVSVVDKKDEDDEEENVLGGGGEDVFTFKTLEDEYGVSVDVLGGNVRDETGRGTGKWEAWIGGCL